MNILEKIIDIFDRIFNVVTYSLFLFLFIFGIYCIHNSLALLDASDVPTDIKNLEPTDKFDLASLQEINKDIVGWIKINDTNIDYPIVQGDDNVSYLNMDYKKEFSLSGTIFMDYRNSIDKIDNYTILFGHNMDKNKMFGDVNKYFEPKFIDSHSKGKLYLKNGSYNFEIFSFMLVDGYEDTIYNINNYKTSLTDKLINFIKDNSEVYKEVQIDNNSKFIVLSTCSRSDERKRSIIIGKIET